jgi:hypothetical protein
MTWVGTGVDVGVGVNVGVGVAVEEEGVGVADVLVVLKTNEDVAVEEGVEDVADGEGTAEAIRAIAAMH